MLFRSSRDDEAEEFLHSALVLARENDFKVLELEPLGRLVRLLRAGGRNGDASAYEVRLSELSPTHLSAGFRPPVEERGAWSAPSS